MKKIPTLFERARTTTRLVYNEVTSGCEWVLAGEGVATRKWDGTACMMRDGCLYKRHDCKRVRDGKFKPPPPNWEPCQPEPDFETGHWPGWLPVGEGSEDKWHREAVQHSIDLEDGTYELCGPKVQGNPESLPTHSLIRHGQCALADVPRDFYLLRGYLWDMQIEGVVFYHPDGRMAKIKRRDFGFIWPIPKQSPPPSSPGAEGQ